MEDVSEFRETCWDVTKRGGVGETILHLCLLSSTSLNSDLAKRLIKFFPKLINDIYMDEQYYGDCWKCQDSPEFLLSISQQNERQKISKTPRESRFQDRLEIREAGILSGEMIEDSQEMLGGRGGNLGDLGAGIDTES